MSRYSDSQPLRCERSHQGPRPVAKFTASHEYRPNEERQAICGIHRAAALRGYRGRWNADDIRPLDAAEEAGIRDRLRERQIRLDADDARRRAEGEVRYRERVQRAWDAYPGPAYEAKVEVEERYGGISFVEYQLAPRGGRPGWDGATLVLDVPADEPVTITARNVHTLTARAARDLARLLLHVADVVDEANAQMLADREAPTA